MPLEDSSIEVINKLTSGNSFLNNFTSLKKGKILPKILFSLVEPKKIKTLFFIGFFIYGLNAVLIRFPMTPISLSIYIWIILHYRTLSGSSLSSFIIDVKMFIIILF